VVTGSKNLANSLLTLEFTLNQIRNVDYYNDIKVGYFAIENIVGHGITPFKIDLKHLSSLPNIRPHIKYDSREFAGAIFKVTYSKETNEDDEMIESVQPKERRGRRSGSRQLKNQSDITFIVFQTGQFIAVGAPSYQRLKDQITLVYRTLKCCQKK
jgi:TATA-box binding protein (TBP) (component of TFIID and TFIIIB)